MNSRVKPEPNRETSAPTGSRPITAIALDHRIDWASIELPPEWQEQRRYTYGRTYRHMDDSLFVFGFGAVVLDGADRIPPEVRAAIETNLRGRVLVETQETYHLIVEPEAQSATPRVGWDRVVITELRPELVSAVALLLGQSVALERYELAVDSLLDETLTLSRELARRGRLPRSTRALIERLGRLTGDRLELARWFFLVDRPEETWEDPRVAQLYDALFSNLELRHRHEAMLHKLAAAERATQSALDMWHGNRSNALEWAIVILIVIEIVFGVWGLL